MGFYATIRMLYCTKVHTELQTAFLRDKNCILASFKLHSTNGIEIQFIFLMIFSLQWHPYYSPCVTNSYSTNQRETVSSSPAGWLSVEMLVIEGSSGQR